jgi:hypothetical protein
MKCVSIPHQTYFVIQTYRRPNLPFEIANRSSRPKQKTSRPPAGQRQLECKGDKLMSVTKDNRGQHAKEVGAGQFLRR